METKHTKGEWITNEGQIYPRQAGKTLALIPYYDEDDKEQEANAKLIAAAPDLLNALIGIVEFETRMREGGNPCIGDGHLSKALEAIEKATE